MFSGEDGASFRRFHTHPIECVFYRAHARTPRVSRPAKPPGKSSRLVARRDIGEEQCAARVDDRGKREQHRAVVQSEAVAAAAVNDPAPKRPNEGPHGERREGAKDDSADRIHRATWFERGQA
jgi:hypothetical protein